MAIQQHVKDGRDITVQHILKKDQFFSQWLILSIALIAIGSIIGLNIFLEYGRTLSREQDRLLASTKILQENIGQNLIATRDVLLDLRQYLPKGRADKDLITRLQALTDAIPGVRNIGIIDASGTFRASNRLELIGKNFSQRDYFRIPRKQPDEKILYITPPFKSTLGGTFTLNVGVIIPGPKGEFAGVVTASLDPNYFAPIMDSVLYAPDMWVAVAHWEGFLFMISPEIKGLAGEKFPSGGFFYQHRTSGKVLTVHSGKGNITGDDRLLVARTVLPRGLNIPTPLVVGASRSNHAIFAKWLNDSLKFASLFGIIVLISILGLYTFQRRQRQFSRQAAEAANALKQSEMLYRHLFETMNEGIVYQDVEGKIIRMNPAAEQILGKSMQDFLGQTTKTVEHDCFREDGSPFPGHDLPAMVALRTGHEVQNTVMGVFNPCEHRLRWININAIPVFHQGAEQPHQVYTVFSDITIRKQAEQYLCQSEEKFRLLAENASDIIWTTDLQIRLTYISPSVTRILGFTAEEALMRTMQEAYTPHSFAIAQRHFAEVMEREVRGENDPNLSLCLEIEAWHKNGHAVPLEISFSFLRDSNGHPNAILAIARDITERKEAEKKLALFAGELERSNKELDDFAYIASHDLKEPLRGIHNYASFLLEDYADKLDNAGKDKLNTLLYLTKRLEGFINDLLKFSRIGRVALTMREIEMDEVVKDALALLKPTWEKEHVSIRIPRPLPTVKFDHYQLVEVFQNLISNAVKYNNKPDKWIEIGYTNDENMAANNYIFYVRDNGIGIDKKHFDSIFAIFKRLHARDKFGGGTGAGLTIVKKIIERHGGKMWLESTPAEGTTFYFTLQGEKNEH
jgi:PAS domain S-box-containing protein